MSLALGGLSDAALGVTADRVRRTVAERGRVAAALAATPGVRRVHASDANFLLVRFGDVARARRALLDAGIVVRAMDAFPGLDDALRITIGDPDANDAVLVALAAAGAPT